MNSKTFYNLPFDSNFNSMDYTLNSMSSKSTFCLNTCLQGTNVYNSEQNNNISIKTDNKLLKKINKLSKKIIPKKIASSSSNSESDNSDNSENSDSENSRINSN